MKKFAIRFGDNDFGNTFRGVLETILNGFEWSGDLPKDKEQLAIVINELSLGCYITYQNMFRYSNEPNPIDDLKRTKQYLQVVVDQLMVDDEVDHYVKTTTWNNSETFILDTTLYANKIYSI